ncbi:hypothetical protein Tco_0273144 [Tanacetum coccineum]
MSALILHLEFHKIPPLVRIIGKSTAGVLTRRKLKESASDQHQALLSFMCKQNRTNHKDHQTCLFACFLSQEEPKKVFQALAVESWVEAMQEELLQFKLQNGTDKEEKCDYDEVVCTSCQDEAIRLFSFGICIFHGLYCYQMDVKSAFLPLATSQNEVVCNNSLQVLEESCFKSTPKVIPDLIGPWLQQFWATASLRVINEVPHIRAMVAGKRWKYLVHVLLHCLSPKSTSWEQFGTNIASALVILDFIQLFLNKQLGGSRITLWTPLIGRGHNRILCRGKHIVRVSFLGLKVLLRDAQGTPTQSAAQASILQGTAEAQGAADIPQSPNDYTPTDESQKLVRMRGLWIYLLLNREVQRIMKTKHFSAKQIHKLKAKLKKLSKGVKPLVKHHLLWVKSQKLKTRGKKQKKKVSSVNLGRYKVEGRVDENSKQVIIEKKRILDVKVEDTEELDLEKNSKSFETAHDVKLLERFQAEWDTEEKREKGGRFEETKTKTISKTYILTDGDR